ncbi:hypothetical protein DYI37_14900 [Fulvimarina endophytica]|uniref:YfdX family protein n=1 Tax=Fulvimarina endophytica TaxID=2293836 RepID=A0A371WZW8_9HYPH|nr:YfdX family protein [Fulvimarina endophytica]RFC62540.1 hypothetical protein DYI37_14900 [Fulvimarina endophytica]
MFMKSAFALVLVGATALSPVAFAASEANAQAQSQQQSSMTDQQDMTVSKDFQKLSEDGVQAFRNVQMARVAIFDGKTDMATKLVDQAVQQLQSAKTDGSAFEKAHSELVTMDAKAHPADTAKTSDTAKTATQSADASKTSASGDTQVWLPIDGQVILGADYQVSDTNNAAVTKANAAMKAGDAQGAKEQLKLAGVDVDFAVAMVPLDQTIQDVQQAQNDLKADKYYEANLELKKVSDNVVVAEMDAVGVPDSGSKTANAKSQDQSTTGAASQDTASNSGHQNKTGTATQ